jgi:hypothetical protein
MIKRIRGNIIAWSLAFVSLIMLAAGVLVVIPGKAVPPPNIAPVRSESTVSGSDEFYRYIPMEGENTGEVTIGRWKIDGVQTTNQNFYLAQEQFNDGRVNDWLDNAESGVKDLKNSRLTKYPVFSSVDMQGIVDEKVVEAPVILLDNENKDQMVLFELTNLYSVNMDTAKFKFKGKEELLPRKSLDITEEDFVYARNERLYLLQRHYDSEAKYDWTVSDAELAEIRAISQLTLPNLPDGGVLSINPPVQFKNYGNYVQGLKRVLDALVKRYNPDVQKIFTELKEDHSIMDAYGAVTDSFDIHTEAWVKEFQRLYGLTQDGLTQDGVVNSAMWERIRTELSGAKDIPVLDTVIASGMNKIAYNTIGATTIRGMFDQEGLYEFSIPCSVIGEDSVKSTTITFSFYIVDKANYKDYPRFPQSYRTDSVGEIYNYVFTGDFPVISYNNTRFNVGKVDEPFFTVDGGWDELTAGGRDGQTAYRLYKVGSYFMRSEMKFIDHIGNEVILKRYTDYRSNMNIIGFQAYYGRVEMVNGVPKMTGMSQFWDNTGANGSADISTALSTANSGSFKSINVATRDDALTFSRSIVNYLDYQSAIAPVITNAPPVQLVGNIDFAKGTDERILSTVAYHSEKDYDVNNNRIWHHSALKVGWPYSDAGEYVITLYFSVSGVLQRQVFYFRINNATDVRFQTDGVNYTFDQVVENGLYTNKPVMVYYNSQGSGPYQVTPEFELQARENGFTGRYNKLIEENYIQTVGGETVLVFGDGGNNGDNDGSYRFIMRYGAFGQAESVADIIIDTADAGNILATPTNDRPEYKLESSYGNTGMPRNTAVFGAKAVEKSIAKNRDDEGEEAGVTISWGNKASGIGYTKTKANVEFRAFAKDTPLAVTNKVWNDFANGGHSQLYSLHDLAYSRDVLNLGAPTSSTTYDIIRAENDGGWRLKDKLSASGIYVITIFDDLDIATDFVLVIDGSTANFAQSTLSAAKTADVNFVDFDPDEGIKLGFGKWKVVTTGAYRSSENTLPLIFDGTQDPFTELYKYNRDEYRDNPGILKNITRVVSDKSVEVNAMYIPIIMAEYSKDGGGYTSNDFRRNDTDNGWDPNTDALERGYFTFTEEGTYYIRITDALGNVAESYIILSHDKSMGTAFADNIASDIASNGAAMANSTAGLVDVRGGMTNRDFVTFSYYQTTNSIAWGNFYCIDYIDINFYPLNYAALYGDDRNQNYPFARFDSQYQGWDNYYVYLGRIARDSTAMDGKKQYASGAYTPLTTTTPAGPRTISLYLDNNTPTAAGIYQISRHYRNTVPDYGEPAPPGNTNYGDTQTREYYFIVDDTGMLDYTSNTYKTGLQVDFGSKTAEALDFDKNRNDIESNLVANVHRTAGKFLTYPRNFPHYDTQILYTLQPISREDEGAEDIHEVHEFPSLVPRYSVINDGAMADLGRGLEETTQLGGSSDDINYDLVVADGARAFYYLQSGDNVGEIQESDRITSANYGVLRLRLDVRAGSKGNFLINNRVGTMGTTIYSNNAEGTRPVYTTIVNPDKVAAVTEFTFEFEVNPESFVSKIDTPPTWSKTAQNPTTGMITNVALPSNNFFLTETKIDIGLGSNDDNMLRRFKYNMKGWDNSPTNPAVTSYSHNDRFYVTLTTEDNLVTQFVLIMDAKASTHNIDRVRDRDNLTRQKQLIGNPATIAATYIYGIDNAFKFTSQYKPGDTDYYLGVKEITYSPVPDPEALGADTPSAKFFDLDSNKTFADIVNLDNYGTAYYFITETDYANNITSYYVQLKGDDFVDDIVFNGQVPDTPGDNVLGMDMQVKSVDKFWKSNSAFRVNCVDDYYFTYNGQASWSIGGVKGGAAKSKARFIEIFDGWINTYANSGKRVEFEIFNRFKEIKLEFYNIKADTKNLELGTFATEDAVFLRVTNREFLPEILTDGKIADLYQVTVYDPYGTEPNKQYKPEQVVVPHADQTLNTFIMEPRYKELIIVVTDPFGREFYTEWHGGRNNIFELLYAGNTVTRSDGLVFVGDSRGVSFRYSTDIYEVEIFRDGVFTIIEDMMMTGNLAAYTFRPRSDDTTLYRIVARGQLSGAVLYDKSFQFDTALPEIEFKTTDGDKLDIDSGQLMGTVVLHINDTSELSFGGSVSFIRTQDNVTERTTIPTAVREYPLTKTGNYKVIVRNGLWAEDIYEFELIDLGSAALQIYDDGVELSPSPEQYTIYLNSDGDAKLDKEGDYTIAQKINNYIYTTPGDVSPTSFDRNGLKLVVPQSYYRQLVGVGNELGTFYIPLAQGSRTLVWRFAVPIYDDKGEKITGVSSPTYFATTGIAERNITGGAQGVGLNFTNTTEIYAGESHRIYLPNNWKSSLSSGMTQTSFPAAGITVSMKPAKPDIFYNGSSEGEKGNLLFVDYYRNGIYAGQLKGKESITIKPADSGSYEFYVRDLAGNKVDFGGSDHYTLVNVSAPFVMINGENPISGRVYNNYVNFQINDVPLARQTFGEEYFNENFYIREMSVTLDTEELEDYKIPPDDTIDFATRRGYNNFQFSKSGTYEVNISYIVEPFALGVNNWILDATYVFQIVSTRSAVEEFNYTIPSGLRITRITRSGYDVTNNYNLLSGSVLTFKAEDGAGLYTVTTETDAGIMSGARTQSFSVYIGRRAGLPDSSISTNVSNGSSTKTAVTVQFNPYQIWANLSSESVTIILYQDGVETQRQVIDGAMLAEQKISAADQKILTIDATKAGQYVVAAFDTNGNVLFSNSWTIEEAKSNATMTVALIVAGVLAIAAVVFIRLRIKMKVR